MRGYTYEESALRIVVLVAVVVIVFPFFSLWARPLAGSENMSAPLGADGAPSECAASGAAHFKIYSALRLMFKV